MILGAPYSYGAMGLVGVPVYFLLRRLGKLARGYVVAIGASVGAVLMTWVVGQPGGILDFVTGALCGMGSALLFWLIAHPAATTGPVAA
jgi:hypothetical protein